MGSKSKTLALLLFLMLFPIILQPVASIATTSSNNNQGNWSMFGSNPSHDRVGTASSTTSILQTPLQLWQSTFSYGLSNSSFQFAERSLTEPIVDNDVLYIGAKTSVTISTYNWEGWVDIYALKTNDGSIVWDFRDTSCNRITPPSVVNNVVYFATDRYICALEASNGHLLWNYSTGAFLSFPIVAQNTVLMGIGEGSKGTLLALNAATGQNIWNFTNEENSRTFGTPAIANGLVFVGSYDENLYALNISTGKEVWKFNAGDFHPTPTVEKNIVYAMTSQANIYALNASSGVRIWNYSIFEGLTIGGQSYFAVSDNVLYAINGINKIYAINGDNGSQIWNQTFAPDFSYGLFAPTVVNEFIYLGTVNGLCALNRFNGQVAWNYSTGSVFEAPIVANGVLYVCSNEQVHAMQILSSTNEPKPESMIIENASIVLAVTVLILIIVLSALLYRRHQKNQ